MLGLIINCVGVDVNTSVGLKCFFFFYLFEFLGNYHTFLSHADGRLSREANPSSHL